ncbi:MAG: DUF1318 domain-containing protein [Sumerlaeia bacterium]
MNKFLYTILVFSLVLQGCGPLLNLNIKVIGEQTSLENQVLGNYSELGKELLSYSSVRGVDPDGSLTLPPETTESQQQVFAALQNRRYNSDDLNALLRTNVLGEAANGLVVQREQNLSQTNLTQEQVQQIIDEENNDRAVLLNRLKQTIFTQQENQEDEIQWVFATINQDAAPIGSFIQARNGAWSTK